MIKWTLILALNSVSPGGDTNDVQNMEFKTERACHVMEAQLRDNLIGQNYIISCIPLTKVEKQDKIGQKKYRLENMDYWIRKPCPYEICGK